MSIDNFNKKIMKLKSELEHARAEIQKLKNELKIFRFWKEDLLLFFTLFCKMLAWLIKPDQKMFRFFLLNFFVGKIAMLGKKLLINSTEIYNFIILALQSESIFFNNLFALLRHKKQINFTGILFRKKWNKFV